MIPIVTIDGPSGSGKGTLAKRLSSELKWNYLDSGLLYRCYAFFYSREQVNIREQINNKVEQSSIAGMNIFSSYTIKGLHLKKGDLCSVSKKDKLELAINCQPYSSPERLVEQARVINARERPNML